MLDKNEIIILDDVVSIQYQDYLENLLLSMESAWYFSADVAFDHNAIKRLQLEKNYAFSKTFFNISTSFQSQEFNTILPLIFESCNKINFYVEHTLFSRSFFTMPLPHKNVNNLDHIHVDTIEPHLVCLYYVTDSDGDTILYDRTLDEFLEDPIIKEKVESLDYSQPGTCPLLTMDEYIDKSTFKEVKRITPKKGRMVFFNGHRYHTSSRPSNNYRLVINSCVKGYFQ